jgi:hypothetical protein
MSREAETMTIGNWMLWELGIDKEKGRRECDGLFAVNNPGSDLLSHAVSHAGYL